LYHGVGFAPLGLIANAAAVRTSATALAALVYLCARVGHAVSYVFAVPWVRTFAFSAGWACQLVFAYALLAR